MVRVEIKRKKIKAFSQFVIGKVVAKVGMYRFFCAR